MTVLDFVLIAVLVVVFVILVSGPVRSNKRWSAIVTPRSSSGHSASLGQLFRSMAVRRQTRHSINERRLQCCKQVA